MKTTHIAALILSLMCIVGLASFSSAENMPIFFNEPSAQAGALARTCFYYCLCKNSSTCTCDPTVPGGSPNCVAGSNGGNGGSTGVAHSWNIPIREDWLPLTVRFTATSVHTNGNETERGLAGATSTHTFTAP